MQSQSALPKIDSADRPFGCPPDVVLDIPCPPSVNETRRVNRASLGKVNDWKMSADATIMASGQYRFARQNPVGERFELTIIFSEDSRLDLDNGIKSAIDYLRRIELIKNDSKKYMRALHIVWGKAPEGCRLVLRGAA